MVYTYYATVDIEDEEIYCKNVKNLNDFKVFTKDVNGHNKITGFKFKFEHDALIDRNTNYLFIQNKIFHYLDFLSSITLCPTNKNNYKLTVFDSVDKEIVSWNVDTLIPPRSDVDIDLSLYQNSLSDFSAKKIENLRYYYAGIIFYINRLYEFSIREFFKIIETDNSIPRYKEYKTIRHLFSHHPDRLEVASKNFRNSDLKNEFGKFHDDGKIVIIDRYDLNNMHSLLRMAKELKEIVEPRVLN